MPVKRISVTLDSALRMLERVHCRAVPPNRDVVVALTRNMTSSDWGKTTAQRVVISAEGGVVLGREILLALVRRGRTRPLFVETGVSLGAYRCEVSPEIEPAVAANGVRLTTELAVTTWVDDPGPIAETTK